MTMAGYLAYDKRLAKVAKNIMMADPILSRAICEDVGVLGEVDDETVVFDVRGQ
jgi:hypothetical protein